MLSPLWRLYPALGLLAQEAGAGVEVQGSRARVSSSPERALQLGLLCAVLAT